MTRRKGSNNSPILVELDEDLADFVEENCEVNMHQMLHVLDPVGGMNLSRAAGEKLVSYVEKFKKLREAVRRARQEREL